MKKISVAYCKKGTCAKVEITQLWGWAREKLIAHWDNTHQKVNCKIRVKIKEKVQWIEKEILASG